jgi:WD40 repeat protein
MSFKVTKVRLIQSCFPDGKRIASSSLNKSIRVWDAETGEMVSDPFEGHKDRINFVIFSSDGKHFASSFYDNSVPIWGPGAEAGKMISGPFECHAGVVNTVAI